MSFKIATRKQKKLRILLSASSGSGKTLGALLIAQGIEPNSEKIFVIDSEHESATLYAGETKWKTDGFNHGNLNAPFTPESYIAKIEEAEAAGATVIILDSITHEWSGQGGCLEIHSKHGGTFQDWGM